MGSNPAATLRERGIQVTAQRLAVLRAVTGYPHATADSIVEAVRAEIGAISLQSVYDALALLAAEGLIRRIQPAGSPARFEDRVGDNHHHLICRLCGRMVDVACAMGSAPCLEVDDDQGFEIDEAEVVYWGRCPACASRTKPALLPGVARRNPRVVEQRAKPSRGAKADPRSTSTITTHKVTTERQQAQKRGRRRHGS
jgi:Fur family ferric uptake transcriptional regulator